MGKNTKFLQLQKPLRNYLYTYIYYFILSSSLLTTKAYHKHTLDDLGCVHSVFLYYLILFILNL